jgi:hypothetical protein
MREISFEVRSFLKEHIQSVWQLDLLMVLTKLEEPVDSIALSRALYCNHGSVEYALSKFLKAKIVKQVQGKHILYQYMPKDEQTARVIAETMTAYSLKRVEVINLIFSNPAIRQIS